MNVFTVEGAALAPSITGSLSWRCPPEDCLLKNGTTVDTAQLETSRERTDLMCNIQRLYIVAD